LELSVYPKDYVIAFAPFFPAPNINKSIGESSGIPVVYPPGIAPIVVALAAAANLSDFS
jgi:hypothetical protein